MTSNPEEWDRICEKAEREIEPVHDFLETWGPHCGAPREVFRGHLIHLILSIQDRDIVGEFPEVFDPEYNKE